MSSPYSDSWVYEGIVGALPGIVVNPRVALLLQFVLFEAAVLVLAVVYDLPEAAIAGTVAVVVATIGSAELIRLGDQVRDVPVPEAYRRLLFGSNIEVVLSVLAYIALITHLFVFDPGQAETPLLDALLGPDPPVLAVYLMLLILWDVCYRIGAGWWASVAALWRTVRYDFDAETRRTLRRIDGETALFGLAQAAFLPFLVGQPVLFVVVAGHIGAVVVVTGASIVLLSR
ncbi:hypothetical protein GRX03_04350 [Halovenus sp. WSH3]|uniref:Uncharacterized protein n=1 Tax=Halovenus carboxidivorans TaxID=2692199 RepID=A0A6B0T0W5_9EURY|nr:hypothetical protein [Halovenus carboxidivorans]MXR50837.1 hypothetical protein [Halovenus carboxidivorans]